MFSYEGLGVYRKAFEANQKVYRLLKENKVIPSYVKNQLGRASLSIMLNIAEGSAKFSNRDRRNFYVIARGSVFECTSLVNFLYGEGEMIAELKDDLCASYEEISKILFAMIKNLEG
jgi:four helix bundle protein